MLVMHDSASVRSFIEGVLESKGCFVKTVPDGVHAIRELRIAAANELSYDIMILDYVTYS